ncbi:nucleoid occlusion protein [Lactobacillus sp. PV037]|uniref:nucleoid occlusion protein n=1 Tax=unclassified Lactobacillus TaxID=2620435 RepID=UPI0022405546|nr:MULTISPECIES: nucleoid occlusion protein [unclassified Lactobacillus]QNQ82809.1 nucleoid occlusion protein [Lactobacillus sp. PV012]QNQ83069.1 nucleoid occlusion protein [Lactobacillus sp. PV037]
MGLFFNRKNDVPKEKQVQEIELSKIVPNPYQPRKTFSEESIGELAQTLEQQGLLQPIILRSRPQKNDEYEIIAGERRYRAAKSLGWNKISAIVEEMDDEKVASLAVIENLQREDLNPIDEAQAYVQLMQSNELTQTELAKQVGKSQSYIANKVRLLKLDPKIQELLVNRTLTQRHGRALLKLTPADQERAAQIIIEQHLNVKDTERLVKDIDGFLAEEEKPEVKKKKVKKPTVRMRTPKDFRLQINTFKEAIEKAKQSGMEVKYKEDKNQDSYTLTIEMLRKQED